MITMWFRGANMLPPSPHPLGGNGRYGDGNKEAQGDRKDGDGGGIATKIAGSLPNELSKAAVL